APRQKLDFINAIVPEGGEFRSWVNIKLETSYFLLIASHQETVACNHNFGPPYLNPSLFG
ncbi:TPA: hypothetical protein ACP9FK_003784, partial [Legionella anisa]